MPLSSPTNAAPHPLDHPRLSVVIPTYNRGPIVANTLRMALQQDYDDYEIIVVDQSPDCPRQVEEIIRSAAGKVRYLHLEVPNLPAARNAGVRAATGEIVVFIDDDVEIGSGYLKAHAQHYCDDSVGGVTGMTLSPGQPNSKQEIQAMLALLGAKAVLEDGRAHVCSMIGCNCSYRKCAIIAAGMSDERFTGCARAEDTDLSLRVQHLGFTLLFDPDIRLVHLELSAGGCANRVKSEAKETERLALYAYFLLKNRRIIGTMPVLRNLKGAYRGFALNRRTLLGGPTVIARKQWIFWKSTGRALLCVANPDLPVVEQRRQMAAWRDFGIRGGETRGTDVEPITPTDRIVTADACKARGD